MDFLRAMINSRSFHTRAERPPTPSVSSGLSSPPTEREGTPDSTSLDESPPKDTDDGALNAAEGKMAVLSLEEEYQKGKEAFASAKTWDPAEERLYEIMFLRGRLPMLPTHWDIAFRGVPMADVLFQTSIEYPPLIYALSNRDFHATKALLRLIDLTSKVEISSQSGFPLKSGPYIQKDLDMFVHWAAVDGGYSHLKVVPNILVASVKAEWGQTGIVSYIENRTKTLARVQRAFFRKGRDPNFWKFVDQIPTSETTRRVRVLLDEYDVPGSDRIDGSPQSQSPRNKQLQSVEQDRLDVEMEDVEMTQSQSQELLSKSSADEAELYSRHPPVVYGLFVLHKQVYILTYDSSKGEDSHISFHGIIDFEYPDQSVWNAITAAAVICQARDDLASRLEDFEPLPVLCDDPDA